MKEDKPYPKGAIIVFDLLEEKVNDNSVSEGPRKVLSIMVKDPDRYPETHGWGFEAFNKGDPKEPMVTDIKKQCISCHIAQKESDYTFSKYRK